MLNWDFGLRKNVSPKSAPIDEATISVIFSIPCFCRYSPI
nr:MAG TPA: hypothetical protein [Caudoviricetes sp.]